ncbi:hypothetical protein KBZ21_49650, partial [Streptomyces sp. A73]|nr:hypothetical protein [Streptomyces sp. A73]
MALEGGHGGEEAQNAVVVEWGSPPGAVFVEVGDAPADAVVGAAVGQESPRVASALVVGYTGEGR